MGRTASTRRGSRLTLPYRATSNPAGDLCKAASEGDVQAVQRLLDAGVSIRVPDSIGRTPLHLAVQQGHEPVVRLLLSRGAPVSAPGPSNLQPFHAAILAQDARLARLLFEHGAEIETAPTGITPFLIAVFSGSQEVLNALLELGANPRARVTADLGRGETALHMAVGSWKDEQLPQLLALGIDVNAAGANPLGQTALHIAARSGYEIAARTLLDAGADVNACYATGRTALHEAARYDQFKICELLLERGADIMATDSFGDSALCVAAMQGKRRAASLLLDRSLHLLTPQQKSRILISSSAHGQTETVELLLGNGFDVNGTESGYSALDAAAMISDENTIIFLLKRGANPGIYGEHRWHSAQLVGEMNHNRVVGLIDGTVSLPERTPALTKDTLADSQFLAWFLTLSETPSSKTRVMANPTPGDLSAPCPVCLDLDFRKGVPKDTEVVHFVFQGSVAEAANRGCPRCQMIQQCLQHLASVYGEGVEAWKSPTGPCKLLSTVRGGPLYVDCGTESLPTRTTVRAEIYSQPGNPVSWPVVGLARDVPAMGWSHERRDLARRFLEQCVTNHSKCSYTDGALPSRVIDVGTNTVAPRLHISNGQKGRYVTLSHCWGGSSHVTTTRATLESRMAGIPLATLPKTFREAILITRDLGAQYLWIDSLCILQDSREDWEKESVKMNEIYENGYVRIAAESAENCHDGCFSSGADHKNRSFSLPVRGPGGRNSKVHFRLTNLISDDKGEVCHRLYSTEDGFQSSPLNNRGWALQERLLAPRTLHFGKSEIGWECATSGECECQTVQAQSDSDSRFEAQLSPTEAADDTAERLWVWSDIIQEFTRRNLTKSSDLLPALSGLANKMSRTTECEYVCGMWRDKLPEFLFWKPDYPYIDDNALTKVPRRHQGGYYAPSWSWASVIAPVKYEDLGEERFTQDRPGDSSSDNPCSIDKGGENLREKGTPGLLKVLDVQTVPSGTNPFGPVKSALLTIRGHLVAASLDGKKKDRPQQSSANGGLLVNTAGPARADFEPDVLDRDAEAFVGEDLQLLFVSESETPEEGARTLPDGSLEGFFRIPFGRGLVLRPTVGGEAGFTRIGTFRFQGAANWKAWRALRAEKTVYLV